MRLIDATKLIQLLCVNMDSGEQFDKATHCVDVMPTVDAVPVDFIRNEIERMKVGNNQYYSECEAYAEDLGILLMEWERRKNETD